MKDPLMENILKGFNQVEKTKSTSTQPGTNVSMSSDPMLAILSNFDAVTEGSDLNSGPGAQQKPYMPGTHTMGKNTEKKHPAAEYLVGGEEGEPDEDEEVISEEPVEEETIAPKQSFADILRSIDEVEKAKLGDKEVQVKEKKKLQQNDKGTYDLTEEPFYKKQDIHWYKKEIFSDLKDLMQAVKGLTDVTIAAEIQRELEELIISAQQSQWEPEE